MPQKEVEVSISSLSLAPHDPLRPDQIFLKDPATLGMVDNARRFAEAMRPVFGPRNVGVSLHVGRVTDACLAISRLHKAGIPVTSLDMPDVTDKHELSRAVIRQLMRGNIRSVLNYLGWSLNNVFSEPERFRQMDAGAVSWRMQDAQRRFLRVSAEPWLTRPQLGDTIRTWLSGHPGVGLAMEISASQQVPWEYMRLVRDLNDDPRYRHAVFLDIDLGHVAESQDNHGQPVNPLRFLDRVLRDPQDSRLVAMVTLNQYRSGHETHTDMFNGRVNFADAAYQLGRAAADDRLAPGVRPALLIESHPPELEMLISPQGIRFMAGFRKAYDAANAPANEEQGE